MNPGWAPYLSDAVSYPRFVSPILRLVSPILFAVSPILRLDS